MCHIAGSENPYNERGHIWGISGLLPEAVNQEYRPDLDNYLADFLRLEATGATGA